MYNIYVRRATEVDYGVLAKNGKALEFLTEDDARKYGRENIEGKSMFIVSWYAGKAQ